MDGHILGAGIASNDSRGCLCIEFVRFMTKEHIFKAGVVYGVVKDISKNDLHGTN